MDLMADTITRGSRAADTHKEDRLERGDIS